MRENPAGEAQNGSIRLLSGRRLRLESRGVKITTDAGLLAVRELDEMTCLTDMAGGERGASWRSCVFVNRYLKRNIGPEHGKITMLGGGYGEMSDE
jgi:hypothetical protein